MRLEIAQERIAPFGADPSDAINGTAAGGAEGAGGAGGAGAGGGSVNGTSSSIAGVVSGPGVSSGCTSPPKVPFSSPKKSPVLIECFKKLSAIDNRFLSRRLISSP
jgi:hypothetical protein